MLSYGAGFALWTALALTKVSGVCGGGRCEGRPSQVPAKPGNGGSGGGQASLPRTGTARSGERVWEAIPGAGVSRRLSQGFSPLSLRLSPQAAPGEAAGSGCSANLTEGRVAGQSVRLRWGAAGPACNFSLSGRSEDGEAAGCQPAPTGNGSYGCSLRGLEAGTWYHLRIEPLAGGEAVNISVQTGTGGARRGRCAGGREGRRAFPSRSLAAAGCKRRRVMLL